MVLAVELFELEAVELFELERLEFVLIGTAGGVGFFKLCCCCGKTAVSTDDNAVDSIIEGKYFKFNGHFDS